MDGEQGRREPGQQPGGSPRAARVRLLPDGPATPRLDALDGLLRDLDGLRRTIETDLTLAAAALDADEAVLAAALVHGDREQLAAFEVRALGHLRALERADVEAPVPPANTGPAPHPLPVRRRRRALRLARLLPAAPLVAAAAALVGLLGIPQTASRPAPPQVSGTPLSSWEELARLSAQDAPAEQVRQAAMDLNADIASMLARAGDDPAAARQALALLHEAQAVLSADDDVHALSAALVQARQLAARVLASLPPTSRPSVAPPVVLPTVPAPVLPSPRRDEQGARPQRASSPGPQPDDRPRRQGAVPRRQDGQAGPARAARPQASPTPSTAASPDAAPAPGTGATTSSPTVGPSPSGRPAPPPLPGPVADPL